jgi:thiosulfate dehydrogenase (quinone) large subunit
LNLLYLLAGSAGINPVMLILSLFLLLAWKVSGFYGLDRVVLPAITAWLRHRPAKKGTLLREPNIPIQPSKPTITLDELHGFE